MGDVGNNGAYARLRAQATSMRRKAESVGNKLQTIAEDIAKKYGARVTPINYKSVDSIVRKAKGEANGIKDIKDSYRTTIIADNVSILHTLTIKADFHKPANTYKEDNTLLYIN